MTMTYGERVPLGSMRCRGRRWAMVGAGVFIGSTLAACEMPSSPTPSAPRFMVGTVDDSDAWVGIVTSDRRARVFVCGGPSSVATTTHWFPVDVDEHGLAQSDAGAGVVVDGPALQVQMGASSAEGTVTLQEVTYTLHATAVRAGTIAGLYEANGQCGKLGLIVTQPAAGAEAMAQGACVPSAATAANGFSKIVQVNPLQPVARAADGSILVTVTESGEQVPLFAAAPQAP
ncbi:MAG: hypothetical protein JOZ69_01600 [Myxococcales bacterium]|nr:hypothetical protein [Myxococcales bacterium]